MTAKKAPRKRKESVDITNEFSDGFKQTFNCSNIKMKKMLPITDNQTSFYYLTQNEKTNMILLDGPAGSAKTYCAVYTALELLKEAKVDKIIYIRTVVESASKSIGFLKGDEDSKLAPYILPFIDKALESTDKVTVNSLIEQEYIKAIPVNFVRGLTFNNSVVIFDEVQNATRSEITTVLTRFGRNSKFILIGDSKQKDIKDSGFETVYNLFDTPFSDKNNIHCIKFDNSDIVRSPILKHITQVLSV
jgi:phosphate starvation-inducible PhoH-like protein